MNTIELTLKKNQMIGIESKLVFVEESDGVKSNPLIVLENAINIEPSIIVMNANLLEFFIKLLLRFADKLACLSYR